MSAVPPPMAHANGFDTIPTNEPAAPPTVTMHDSNQQGSFVLPVSSAPVSTSFFNNDSAINDLPLSSLAEEPIAAEDPIATQTHVTEEAAGSPFPSFYTPTEDPATRFEFPDAEERPDLD